MSWFRRLWLAICAFLEAAKEWDDNSVVQEGILPVKFDGKSDSVPDPDRDLDFQAPPGATWPDAVSKDVS